MVSQTSVGTVSAGLTSWGRDIRGATSTALLTMALSLPQGLLALPIAVAEVGLLPGLLSIVAIGALNVVTVAWTAERVATTFAKRGVICSLSTLADEQLGRWGKRLTVGSSAALFFLALLASIVGLARSLAELSQLSAPLWGTLGGLMLGGLALGGVVLSGRLLASLGILNIVLLTFVIGLTLRHDQSHAVLPVAAGSPLLMVGVSLMLFFAPVLVAPAAQQQLPRGVSARAFVWGSAAGAGASAGLFMLWGWAVCRLVGTGALVNAAGTVVPILGAALPEGGPLTTLLGLLLLGMTALRCTLVLRTITAEQLAARSRWPSLVSYAPAAVGLVVALVLLLSGTSSFTQLIAIGGGIAASLTSLLIPALLAHSRHPQRASFGKARGAP